LLSEQIKEFRPKLISYQNNGSPESLAGGDYEFMSPEEIARHPQVDLVVVAMSGKSGLIPTLAAVKAGKNIALANKESLVVAGEIITTEAKLNHAQILPVDSEHSAIWQCLRGEKQPPDQIILTASGGPFRDYSPAQLSKVTAKQALNHPSWQMGEKVTVDSATLMNKGLEMIEARWLFNIPLEKIKILIHPQSIVHSMVELADGSIKAQLSYPDMRLPIQYALSYPERLPNPKLPRLDWSHVNSLTFKEPDMNAFPCLRLAIEAGRKGGTYPAVICAADEAAVELFLAKRIKFTEIAILIEKTLAQHQTKANPKLEDILAAYAWARDKIIELVTGD